MAYASATHYQFLNLISRHFTSAITWTSNTGPLVAPLGGIAPFSGFVSPFSCLFLLIFAVLM